MPLSTDGLSEYTGEGLYSGDYKDQCFFAWYRASRPSGAKLIEIIPANVNGKKPGHTLISKWIKDFSWHERADILDAEVTRQVETKAVQEKVEMFQRQAELGKKLQDLGAEFFENNEVTKAAVALQMIVRGAEIEKASRGIPDALIKVAQLKDEDLNDLVGRLMSKVGVNEMEAFTKDTVSVLKDDVEKSDSVEGEFSNADDE
jgi:hypothetical protein